MPDLAFVLVNLLSEEEEDLLVLLFEVGVELEVDELMPVLPWLIESILEPLWLESRWLEPLWFEAPWLELPDDMPLDMLPDWLDD